MSLERNSLASLLTLVAFLVLIAMAAVLYGGSKEQQAQMEQNFFWQKTFLVFETAKAALQGLVDLSLGTKTSENGPAASGEASGSDLALNLALKQSAPSGDWWSGLWNKIKEEWNKSDTDTSLTATAEDSPLRWEKTETGAEIVWQAKNGEEYKLSLPFQFLSR